jgi:hypothetical protein
LLAFSWVGWDWFGDINPGLVPNKDMKGGVVLRTALSVCIAFLDSSKAFTAPGCLYSSPIANRSRRTTIISLRVLEQKIKEEVESTTTAIFDPLELILEPDGKQQHFSGAGELLEDKQGLSLWAARGILLFVAAIWGTNFAVRS